MKIRKFHTLAGTGAVLLTTVFSTPAKADIVQNVDCDDEGSINAVLLATLDDGEPLRINVSGVCRESVEVRRRNVTIAGAAPGATVASGLADSYTIAAHPNAGLLILEDLRIYSRAAAVLCNGSTVEATNLDVRNAQSAFLGVNNGTCNIFDSRAVSPTIGANAIGNGHVNLLGVDILTPTFLGASAAVGGSVSLGISPSTNAPTRILSSQSVGVRALPGGSIISINSRIFDSTQHGIDVFSGGNFHVSGPTIVRGSFGNGLNLLRNSEVLINFNSGDLRLRLENSLGWGISCQDPDVGLLTGPGPTFSGNVEGEINPTCWGLAL